MKARSACYPPTALAMFVCLAIPAFAAHNELTPAEKADGWRLLFDGRTFAGWRNFRSPGSPVAGWEIKDGILRTIAGGGGAQLVTERKFSDFEFEWEWRLTEGGNNGVKYFVTDARPRAPGLRASSAWTTQPASSPPPQWRDCARATMLPVRLRSGGRSGCSRLARCATRSSSVPARRTWGRTTSIPT